MQPVVLGGPESELEVLQEKIEQLREFLDAPGNRNRYASARSEFYSLFPEPKPQYRTLAERFAEIEVYYFEHERTEFYLERRRGARTSGTTRDLSVLAEIGGQRGYTDTRGNFVNCEDKGTTEILHLALDARGVPA